MLTAGYIYLHKNNIPSLRIANGYNWYLLQRATRRVHKCNQAENQIKRQRCRQTECHRVSRAKKAKAASLPICPVARFARLPVFQFVPSVRPTRLCVGGFAQQRLLLAAALGPATAHVARSSVNWFTPWPLC